MTDQIRPPWTPEQVAALNRFQQYGGMHPFTCGQHRHNSPTLVAREDGWHCPATYCDYRQDWTHAFMADPSKWPSSRPGWPGAVPPEPADAPRSPVQAADGPAEPRHAHDGAQAMQGGSGVELLPYPQHAPNACRTTRHCADHGWCHRCNPDFAAVMNRVNIAIQHTDDNDRHWGPLYAAVGQALRGEFAPGSPENPPEPPAAEIPDRDIQQLAVAILRVQRLIDAHPVAVPTNLLEEAFDHGAHDDGPSVTECAKADARWWNGEKEGE